MRIISSQIHEIANKADSFFFRFIVNNFLFIIKINDSIKSIIISEIIKRLVLPCKYYSEITVRKNNYIIRVV
jgi:hypothetical protein